MTPSWAVRGDAVLLPVVRRIVTSFQRGDRAVSLRRKRRSGPLPGIRAPQLAAPGSRLAHRRHVWPTDRASQHGP